MDNWIEQYKLPIVGGIIILTILELLGFFFNPLSFLDVIIGTAVFVFDFVTVYYMTYYLLWFQVRFNSSQAPIIRLIVYFNMGFGIVTPLYLAVIGIIKMGLADSVILVMANGALLGISISAYHFKHKYYPQEGIFYSSEEKTKWINDTKWQLKTIGWFMGIIIVLCIFFGIMIYWLELL